MFQYDTKNVKRVEFDAQKIGIMLLESITSGLYKNPKNAIREYIQNEYDAGAKEVKIEIREDSIFITGDSEGMNEEEISSATDIGISHKVTGKHVGFRGIGIWSGISICEEIVIFTKKKKDNFGRAIIIDAKGILEDMKDPSNKLVTCLSNRVFQSKHNALENKKGTRVELRKIYSHHRNALSLNKLKFFIEQILPIPINPDFKYVDIIETELKKNVPGYKSINILLNNEKLFRPPFNSEDLSDPCFFFVGTEPLAYGWYSISGGLLPENTRFPIFKQHGFTVGDEDRSNIYSTMQISDIVGLRWVTGEIHIISNEIFPTSERNQFESNIFFDNFKDFLLEKIEEAIKKSRQKSYSQSAESRLSDLDEFVSITPTTREDTIDAIGYGRRLINLAEGNLNRGQVKKGLQKRCKNLIKQSKGKLDDLVNHLAGPIDVGSTVPQTTLPNKKISKDKVKKTKIEKIEISLEGVYPWQSRDLLILGFVIEAMNRVFKPKQIEKWKEAFKDVMRKQIKG